MAPVPVALYGLVLLMCAIAFFILQAAIIKNHGPEFPLRKFIGRDGKGKISAAFYIIGITLSFVNPWIAIICYIVVALLWFVPDKRFERSVTP